ncbi:MAG: His Kinase (phosphoacceptor) domain/Histidine kinase, gyrase and HSP90-like ATPase [Nitrobacter vulgaris]|nr:His Kinase (phosphoacceptor) domain/Histidine kinase, gyrase and HSP90-like ATPase [Nitrobacter vulgaris]
MLNPDAHVADEQHFVLSNLPPTSAQKRLAIGIVLGLAIALYLVIGPFGGVQLGAIHSFVAVYTTAMFVTDTITAILLFAQFSILRSRAILVMASGYLFTALLIVPYLLAFPGVLAPEGIVGGLQASAHLYLLWHCSFPLFVIGYALTKDEKRGHRPLQRKVGTSILRSVVATAIGAAVVAILCIKFDAILPPIMVDQSRFVAEWPWVVGAPIVVLCITALAVLWLRRRSILDLFLMVVLCAYIVEIPPHYYPFPARFSTGWYAVRVTSLISSSIVLVVLLHEITALYGGLLNAVRRQRREREARLMTGDAVAASIAHEVRQPLTAMVTTADAGLRFLDRPAPNLDKAKEAFRRIVADGHRAGDVIGSIRANFKTDVRDQIRFDLNELIEEALTLCRRDLQKHCIAVHVEPNKQLPQVRGNRIQLQQVLLNLIVNATDAMTERDDPRVLSVRTEVYEADRVRISVADTGTGVHSEDADRIFNPLFTKKTDGMGMGLSICRSIIEAHEGQLWFAPNKPQGAVFQFTLRADGAPV